MLNYVIVDHVKNEKKYPAGTILARIDRTTALGNPFYMADESKRDEVCDKFEEYFRNSVLEAKNLPASNKNDSLRKAYDYLMHLRELSGKGQLVLLCWCKPKRCHGDTIAAWINKHLLLEADH
jgi:hypothetical protein